MTTRTKNGHLSGCPLATYLLAGGSTAGRAFQMRQVYRDMDRFIKIWIRLLVILRQIVQFFQRRLAFAFQAIVNPRQTNRIIFFVLFSRWA